MKTNLVKGFKDYSGKDAEKRAVIREVIKQTFEKYNFEPAETPVIEYEEFVRGDNKQDEAVSDIYKLRDKGKRKLALRYEFTFQLKRLMKNKKLPYKRFQIGPVFRDEPVTGNRLRQFTQCDIDTIGSTLKDQAEVLAIVNEILTKLKVKPIIYFNNRKLMEEILDKAKIKKKDREQVLRELDRYDKFPETEIRRNLKKYNATKIIDWMKKGEKFFKEFESYSEILELIKYSKAYGVKILFAPTIIRGLSYYNGTIFEVKTKSSRDSICGGGAYTFNNTKSFGCALGLDRLSKVTKLIVDIERYLIVSLNQDQQSISLSNKLRKAGKNVSIYYGKPSKALTYANSLEIGKVIFVGEKEVKSGKLKVKDLKTGKESNLVFGKIVKRK